MTKFSDNDSPSLLFTEQGSNPSTPASSKWRLFFKSTGLFIIEDTGSTVGPMISSAGAGAVTLITDTTVAGSPAANFDFTSISGSYKHLRLYVQGRSNDSSSGFMAINMTFNNDTGANYDWQRITTTTGSVAAAASAGQTSARIGLTLGDTSAAANNAGGTIIEIPNYAATVFNKNAQGAGHEFASTSTTLFLSETNYMTWRNTAAITRVTLTPNAGSWKIGSRATLYGIS